MDTLLKERVIALVNNCDDEDTLKTIESNLLVEDWWDTDFTKEEQDEMLEASKQVKQGVFTTNEDAMKIFDKWKGK
jgi:hypothetical protein